MAKSILILNAPELLGTCSSDDANGLSLTLVGVESACNTLCSQLGIEVDFRQTDSEHEMARAIINSASYDGLIINPAAAFKAATARSAMLRHAITLIAPLKQPVIEVHINNIFEANADVEPLRITAGELGFIAGLGINSYLLAIRAISKRIDQKGA